MVNKNAVKPSKSLNILYDTRDKYSQFIVELAGNLEIFKNRVELEKTTIGMHPKNMQKKYSRWVGSLMQQKKVVGQRINTQTEPNSKRYNST